jgi:CheY-like chemotaxis protein
MRRGPWQVQIIDDEVVILLAVSRAYRDKSVDIVTASNAVQALAQMDIFNFDLFLLDLDMKDRCSYKLLKTMTERFPDIPVILMTTGDIESKQLARQVEEVRLQGCWHLLEKPFDYKKLTSVIDRGLQERSVFGAGGRQCGSSGSHGKRRCRRFPRIEQINLSLPTHQEKSDQSVSFPATLTDISVGGLGLTSPRKLVAPQLVHFDEKFMHQSGVIVWSRIRDDQTFRAGIKFT